MSEHLKLLLILKFKYVFLKVFYYKTIKSTS